MPWSTAALPFAIRAAAHLKRQEICAARGQEIEAEDQTKEQTAALGQDPGWRDASWSERTVMTPDQLDVALHDIRWTPDILARALECDVSLIHAWLDGNAEIPMKVGIGIKILAEAHQAFAETKPTTVKGKKYRQ